MMDGTSEEAVFAHFTKTFLTDVLRIKITDDFRNYYKLLKVALC